MKTNTNKKIWRLALAGVVLISLGAWTYSTLMENKEAVEGRVYERDFTRHTPVQVTTVKKKSLSQTNRLLGTFEPKRELEVKVQTQGEIIREAISEGQSVKAGAMIAKVDDEQLRFQLIAAEAELQDAKQEVVRYKNLTENDAVAKVQLDNAQLRLAKAESQVGVLNKQIQQTTVRAPFDGVITSKMFEKGTIVAPGMPLAHLVEISTLKLIVQVSEEDLLAFQEGQVVKVSTDVHPEASYQGIVSMVGAMGDASHNFPVHVTVENSEEYPLRAGMYGSIQFDHSGSQEKLVIPRNALVGSSRNAGVYKVEDSIAYLQEIVLGTSTGEELEVISGLQSGDQIVINGQINLTDSTVVVIR
ncbi:efflux RND transporter periplasmic adaptor subunit [Catalinimonas niigatensis]|uniref:efflux RND transporter periplasmic adaptor subunit n=1 Tax=Catalinimonas niigatensis TaxID=1397264 RepID=UPI00266598FB|nr:efflux RND transporter periplasmic adaptor subunit [Catalinimonas niigatensis]WPP52595.1 efflux RND transporter periplasmic adaptor subunit [Catalinimonas niigatensis]